MSYIVLARKYRPQNFLELYAQDHVTTIIKNALETKRIAHAYLFTGPRGVGKTSLARILAKSLNCVDGPTINPCNACSNCREITLSTAPDVIEIDGASNTGVDDIRELQRELMYAPSQSKYKIYIIDEVHMLSKSAFNALLKTLEEPPENVIFIFATTEAHKVLPTIVSRCQRFDFKRIPIDAIVRRLKDIVVAEGISIDSESMYLIARKADGGMRDALSLMDQVLSYCSNDIRIDKVREIFGILPNHVYQSVLKSIAERDSSRIIIELHSIFEQGLDLSELVNNLMEFTRIVLMQKLNVETLEISPDELPVYKELVPLFKVNDLMYIISVLMQVRNEIRSSSNPFLIVEVALIRLSKMAEMDDLSELIKTIREKGINSTVEQLPTIASLRQSRPAITQKESSPVSSTVVNPSVDPLPKAEDLNERSLKDNWAKIVARIKKESSLASMALKEASILEVSDSAVRVKASSHKYHQQLQKILPSLRNILRELYLKDIRIDFAEPDVTVVPDRKILTINEIIEEHPNLSKLAELTESTIEPG